MTASTVSMLARLLRIDPLHVRCRTAAHRTRRKPPARHVTFQSLLGDTQMKKSMQKGFTLIELMIVVAIIAI
ncbi:MAG: prepilin-type N-terminal cleavage/methylation domain-containing protein, partial [Luteimonas sp.]